MISMILVVVMMMKVVMMVLSQIKNINQQNMNMCYVSACVSVVFGVLPFFIVFYCHYIDLCIFPLYHAQAKKHMSAMSAERDLLRREIGLYIAASILVRWLNFTARLYVPSSVCGGCIYVERLGHFGL
jgi:hypothetical protein